MAGHIMLSLAISAGCGMLLFFNDPGEALAIVLNAYRSGRISEARMQEATLDALAEKLMEGPQAFRGSDRIDSYCGLFDAHL